LLVRGAGLWAGMFTMFYSVTSVIEEHKKEKCSERDVWVVYLKTFGWVEICLGPIARSAQAFRELPIP
jgi:hypothetical protein